MRERFFRNVSQRRKTKSAFAARLYFGRKILERKQKCDFFLSFFLFHCEQNVRMKLAFQSWPVFWEKRGEMIHTMGMLKSEQNNVNLCRLPVLVGKLEEHYLSPTLSSIFHLIYHTVFM